MAFKKKQHKLFTRRSLILGATKLSLSLYIMGHLYYLQIIRRKHFQLLSDKNRIYSQFLLPPRGKILDHQERILADVQNSYRAMININEIKNVDKLINNLKKIIFLNNDGWDQIYFHIKQNKKYSSLILKENLSWEELTKLELYSPHFPEINIEKGYSRYYHYPELTCHFVGYVALPSSKELKNLENNSIFGIKIGKSGLEQTYNNYLQGQAGIKHTEVNALRQKIRTIGVHPSTTGKNLKLTLNLDLQKKCYEELQKFESSAAIVLNVETGAILSCVSYPSFNTNLFSHNILQKDEWKNLEKNIYKPMTNKVISGQYAPGSTFKMIVALAALNKGIIDEKTNFNCAGHFDYNGHIFHCWTWRYGGHGNVNIKTAISRSCDVFFYNLATQLDVDDITQTAHIFGFGQITGVEILGEKKGLLPTKKWLETIQKRRWSKGDTINLSIGQGGILTTPIQIAKMMAQFINGGIAITPHFVKDNHQKNITTLPFKKKFFEIIKGAMIDVINAPWGTSYASRISSPYTFGGKTGSTQVSRITQEQRKNGTFNQRLYHLREHALFCGFAPIDQPKFATCVIVEHGRSGGRVAAPIGKEILLTAQKTIKL